MAKNTGLTLIFFTQSSLQSDFGMRGLDRAFVNFSLHLKSGVKPPQSKKQKHLIHFCFSEKLYNLPSINTDELNFVRFEFYGLYPLANRLFHNIEFIHLT
jgi:hypothetical protein